MMGEVHTGAEMAKNIAQVLRAGRAGIGRDLDRLGTRLVDELRLDLSQPGRGRTYTTWFYTDTLGRVRPGGPRPPHTASAPGDPPAVDFGMLRASYGHDVSPDINGFTLSIGTGDEKAKFLEFGTTKVEPRPHLRPLIHRNHGTIRDAVADGVTGREKAMARRLGGRG